MKKIMSLLLAALMIVSITSCGKTEQNVNDNDVNEPADSDEQSKENRYVFYSGGYTDGGTSGGKAGFLNASALQFDPDYQITDKIDTSSLSQTKTISLNGSVYTLKYKNTRQRPSLGEGKAAFDRYNLYSTYTMAGATQTIRMQTYHTGDLVSLHIVDRNDVNVTSEKLSDGELLKKANDILSDWYGDNVLDKYRLRNGKIEYDEYSSYYDIVYQRMIHGYVADTLLSVTFNNAGEVRIVHSYYHFDYEALENEITAEMIQKAEQALRAQIPSSMTVQENATKVMIDFNTGKLYLRMYARRNASVIDPETGMETHTGEDFYVNIN